MLRMGWVVGVLAMVLGTTAWANKEVARVNGRVLTEKDMTAVLSGMNDGMRASLLSDKASRNQIIETLIDQELLAERAEKEGLDKTQEYKDALENFRKQFLSQRLLALRMEPKVTDSAAKKYFESNKMLFSTEVIVAQHILLENEAEAKDVLAKAKAAGADFQALAEKFSKDPSAKNNRGDLGAFTRDRMVPEFTNAAFSAKIGEIVGPVKTSFGWHIIKVTDKKPGQVLGYEEVELKVKSTLRNIYAQQLVAELRKSAKVTRTP
jgi:peptidyl-prolyl cis-trans isomerase C